MEQTLPFSTWGRWSGRPPNAQATPSPSHYGFKAFLGWDGLVVNEESVDVVDLCRAYMDTVQKESCGQCLPCNLGTQEMTEILQRLSRGEGSSEELQRLRDLAEIVRQTSKCGVGLTGTRPILDALDFFPEEFERALKNGVPQHGKYVARVTAPCTEACPSHLDIPGYVDMIRMGRYGRSLEIVREGCPLPGSIGRTCTRPCEFNCRRTKLDAPIAIKDLKRFADDMLHLGDPEPEPPPPARDESRVAVIGAGPAGLACAYYLGRRGHPATLYEAHSHAGGMAATAIPRFRLPRNILFREIERIEQTGAEIRCNTPISRNISLQNWLEDNGFSAAFVGVGATQSSRMRCEGEDAGYECFMTGLEFLNRIAAGETPLQGDRLVVVGGGNVAMDCSRSALRLGFSEVHLLYRRTQQEMPADAEEFRQAGEEGVEFRYLLQPVRILSDQNGRVVGLECLRMELGEPDDSGRRRPEPIQGSEFVIECDAVIPAIGQTCVVDCVLPDEDQVQLTRWNTMLVDAITQQSDNERIFAGGDCTTGPDTLIGALAAGKRAARHIAQFLETGTCRAEPDELLQSYISELTVFDTAERLPAPGASPRAEPLLSPARERRKDFREVEEGFSQPQALYEASRCLRCYRIAVAAI
ncbi:MAG: FAD-dependent oxidoreductase [Desulfohalobiaceae bacterium]|nr:FAD-dependent oxidoreductase [Desulfohalobiaceae bacterium]